MKRIIGLSMLFGILSSLSAFAVEVPLNFLVCSPAAKMVDWNYIQSENQIDGTLDRQGYVEFKLFSADLAVFSRVRVAVPGLVWDERFKEVSYVSDSGTVVCAQTKWNRFKKLLANCNIEMSELRFVRGPEGRCSEDLVSEFEGRMVVAD